MADKEKSVAGYVKKETVILFVLVAFAFGFVGGVFTAILKSTGGGQQMVQQGQPSAPGPTPAASMGLNAQIKAMEAQALKNPDNVQMWTALGNIYFDNDKYKDAIRAYKKSLAIIPNANVWTDLGVMYRRDKQPKESVKAFDEAIALDNPHEMARFNKGIVLLHDLNDTEKALKSWQALVDINPLAVAPDGTPMGEVIKQYSQK